MSADDVYETKLKCICCGRAGAAGWSEYARPTQYSDRGTSLKCLSEGFIRGVGREINGDSQINCEDCKIPVVSN